MAGESGVDQIQFGPFCLDANGSRVFRDGADLKLRPQAVRVLKALLEMPGQSIDYEPLLKQAWGTTFVSRHTVAMTVGETWKTLEEYGSWIGYRRRVGYWLNISRSDDQIPDRLALVGTKDLRRAREAYCLLPMHGRNRPVRPPRLRIHLPDVFNAGNVWCAGALREVYKEFLEVKRDAIALSGRPSAVLCCFKRQ